MGVSIQPPEEWGLKQMKLFTGTIPSKAWIFEHQEDEVLVSVLMTEGILDGLQNQSKATLIRLYVEEFVSGWGGQVDKGVTHEFEAATFCDGHAGVEIKATFGRDTFLYYGCMKPRQDWSRIGMVVTWIKTPPPPMVEIKGKDNSSDAKQRLSLFLANLRIEPQT